MRDTRQGYIKEEIEGVCVGGVGGGVGRGLTIEVERLAYVLRRRDPTMS